MQHTSLPTLLILLAAFNAQQAISAISPWFMPFLIALAVIGLAALLQQDDDNDRA